MLVGAFSATRNMFLRLIFLGATGLALFQILRTGSRGAFLGLLCCLAIGFLAGNMKTRSSLLFIAPIAALILVIFVPQSSMERLTSITGGNGEAEQSYDARRYLLQRSIDITFEHPILGVGAGQFSSVEGAQADAEGHHHAHWQETHNTFTEVSSEVGIPALLCVLWGVGGSFVLFWRLSKQAKRNTNLRQFAMPAYLLVSGTAGICGALFFVNFGYKLYLIVLTGIAIAIQRAIAATESSDTNQNDMAIPNSAARGLKTL
jgi:O-antigen ligase